MSAEAVLKIDILEPTTVPIEIGGKSYRMFTGPMKTTARRLRLLDKYKTRAIELDEKEDLTEGEETELVECLARAVSLITDVPMEVLTTLNDFQLQAIMQGFSMLQADSRRLTGANGQTAPRQGARRNGHSTGTVLSTASRASTQARPPRIGGTSRRSGMSSKR